MKRTILLCMALVATYLLTAQTAMVPGVYDANGKLVKQTSPCTVSVALTVERLDFTPGVYARYAQKYLGTRAPLAPRTEMRIVDSYISRQPVAAAPLAGSVVQSVGLASNRYDGRPLTLEEQAAATAELIFSLRKHRLELITGQAGENVFGAGLRAALDEIAALENEYLAMFYGSTQQVRTTHSYDVVITSERKDYIVCRYRDGEGFVAVDNLAGEPVMLHIETSVERPSWLVEPGPKDKIVAEYIVLNSAECQLLCGATVLARQSLVLEPYALTVKSLPLSNKQ